MWTGAGLRGCSGNTANRARTMWTGAGLRGCPGNTTNRARTMWTGAGLRGYPGTTTNDRAWERIGRLKVACCLLAGYEVPGIEITAILESAKTLAKHQTFGKKGSSGEMPCSINQFLYSSIKGT